MIYTLKKTQFITADIESVWAFMNDPSNLSRITPPHMQFEVLDKEDVLPMYPGQIIMYYVRPVLNIKLKWVTEITHVKEKEFFVDEQRFGPYAFWHHQHLFKAIPGGVEMSDIIHYKLPVGIFGRLANALFVKKDLDMIFEYRRKKVKEVFKNIYSNRKT